MTIEVREISDCGLEIDVQDAIGEFDEGRFLPKAKQKIETFGALDLLVSVSGFKGWSARSLWQALDFGSDYFAYVRRLAFVGDEVAANWLAVMAEPFRQSDVRFFTVDDATKARSWIRAGSASSPASPAD